MQNNQVTQNPVPQKRNKYVLILVLIIVIGVLLAVSLYPLNWKKTLRETGLGNRLTGNQQTGAASAKHIPPLPHIDAIKLTNSGFVPSKIIINKGTAVTWTNESSSDNASVSSDDYPTNTKFPELNLGKFAIGTSLAHIFTTAGTYTYHNQFNPTDTGTIIVE